MNSQKRATVVTRTPTPETFTPEEIGAMHEEEWAHRHAKPMPFAVTEKDYLEYTTHRRDMTLDGLIADELEDLGDRPLDYDRAIWHGPRLVAAIIAGPGGRPRVVRFDP